MKLPELNQLYVWHTNTKIDFQQVKQGTYPYTENGEPKIADPNKICVYTQSAVINGVNKGLTMVSLEHRKTKIKAFMKESIEKIKQEPDIFLKAQTKPTQLGIYYKAE